MLLFFSLIVLIFSIVLHEVAHGYAADALGDPTARLSGRLTLNPVPHMDPLGSIILPALLIFTHSPILFGWAKPVPYNPFNLKNKRWGEAIVAGAGSATNLLIALLFGLLVRFGADFGLDAAALALAGTVTFVNLFLGLFNLIPFPPLDGFTVLRGILPWRIAPALTRVEERVARAGILSLILFLLIFSYLFAVPFFKMVIFLFTTLTGTGF
jgi:Zn-dependent protease